MKVKFKIEMVRSKFFVEMELNEIEFGCKEIVLRGGEYSAKLREVFGYECSGILKVLFGDEY